jgi:hypothetical protein
VLIEEGHVTPNLVVRRLGALEELEYILFGSRTLESPKAEVDPNLQSKRDM